MAHPIRRRLLTLFPLLALICAAVVFPSAVAAPVPSYSAHCASLVPESAATGLPANASLLIQTAYFTGADSLFGPGDPSSLSVPRSLGFFPLSLTRTNTPGVVAVGGSLVIRGGSIFVVRRNFTAGRRGLFRVVHPRGPGMVHRGGRGTLYMAGFWSEAAGWLCAVGSGSAYSKQGKLLDLSAVLKLNFPSSSNITTSLVTGTLESLDPPGSSNFFDPIALLAYAQNKYEYTLIPEARKMSSAAIFGGRSLGLGGDDRFCDVLSTFSSGLRLAYGADCYGGRNCNPVNGSSETLPGCVLVGAAQCEDGKLHLPILFSDSKPFRCRPLMRPQMMLVGEGIWDHERNHLSVVACRVMNFEKSLGSASVGDCTIRFGLWFPEALTIENTSPIVGSIWSNRSSTDPRYFETIAVRSYDRSWHPVSGLKYEYTKIDLARKSCEGIDAGNSDGKKYPSGKSVTDLKFTPSLRNLAGEIVWAYATPLSIGDTLYGDVFPEENGALQSDTAAEANHNLWNISYKISSGFYNGSSQLKEFKEISAEGIYNEGTGRLCLIGCRDNASSDGERLIKKMNSMDCQILIDVQLSPLDPGPGDHLNGIMKSMRNESDPLYFQPLEISSYIMYRGQAEESIWRMDVEITMVLISLTLSCVFIGLQLFHVKKHPDVLPSTSITMLVVLTLGHMIPLVLNFEALFFMNRNKQNVLLWNGGWLEVNEVIVRLITMVAFLLQFRFLQLAWSARSEEGSKKDLWIAERKALQFCLPLYFIGVVISWFVHLKTHGTQMPMLVPVDEPPHTSLLADLISYAGLVLDGFLLPQILLNVFSNSKDKVLSPIFYGGTTIVRALPHIYDAYRARHYVPHINSSYIYASPAGDFYSSAWDIVIPCEGLLFAIIIYLQQRFGGSCILPPRFKNQGGYETVPVVNG